MQTTEHAHPDCSDCTVVAAASTGHPVGGVRLCPRHRAEADQRMAHARATNPEIAALHAMLGR